jgi:hypothetical protein
MTGAPEEILQEHPSKMIGEPEEILHEHLKQWYRNAQAK